MPAKDLEFIKRKKVCPNLTISNHKGKRQDILSLLYLKTVFLLCFPGVKGNDLQLKDF